MSISNLFSITESDGDIDNSPNGVFTPTTTYPSNYRTIIRGSSDVLAVNNLLPTFFNGSQWGDWIVKENGNVKLTEKGQKFPSYADPVHLSGKTIYGFFFTNTTQDAINGSNLVVNIITNPNYKLDTPEYHGYGRKDISIDPDSPFFKAFYASGDFNASVSEDVSRFFAPICATLGNRDTPTQASEGWMRVIHLAIQDGDIIVSDILLNKRKTITVQTQKIPDYFSIYAAEPVTFLNTDEIIPSLYDRVTALEREMANMPKTIAEGLSLATKEVSKLYTAR